MPKKKDQPLSAAEQRKRFEALARETGAEQSREPLKRILGKVSLSVERKGKPKAR